MVDWMSGLYFYSNSAEERERELSIISVVNSWGRVKSTDAPFLFYCDSQQKALTTHKFRFVKGTLHFLETDSF